MKKLLVTIGLVLIGIMIMGGTMGVKVLNSFLYYFGDIKGIVISSILFVLSLAALFIFRDVMQKKNMLYRSVCCFATVSGMTSGILLAYNNCFGVLNGTLKISFIIFVIIGGTAFFLYNLHFLIHSKKEIPAPIIGQYSVNRFFDNYAQE